MLVDPTDLEQPQAHHTTPRFQNMIAATRPKISDAEARVLKKLLTKYGDIFAMKNDDYGWIDSAPLYRYRRGPTDSQPSRRIP
jgi:hypothetical protein